MQIFAYIALNTSVRSLEKQTSPTFVTVTDSTTWCYYSILK